VKYHFQKQVFHTFPYHEPTMQKSLYILHEKLNKNGPVTVEQIYGTLHLQKPEEL
jgi:hypothetical protein